MARPGKVARGKRRWVGLCITPATDSRESCHALISDYLSDINWKMYDYKTSQSSTLVIIRVPLEECDDTISKLNDSGPIQTLTKSGKIRLVRERLGLS